MAKAASNSSRSALQAATAQPTDEHSCCKTPRQGRQAKAQLPQAGLKAKPPAQAAPPQVRKLAGAFAGIRHSRHVTDLALSMFDQLADRLDMNANDRLLLECAGLLHDIGWVIGQAGHHKESMRMILAQADLGLSRPDQLMVANIARYHRRALPSPGHANYRRLGRSDRRRVRILAGMLRLADGLDRQHLQRIGWVKLTLTAGLLIVECQTIGDAADEQSTAKTKGNLLEHALSRRLQLEWCSIPA